MCGCDCCQSSDPTCFSPEFIDPIDAYHAWVCKCSCPGCIARVIRGAMAYGVQRGYERGLDEGFRQGHVDEVSR